MTRAEPHISIRPPSGWVPIDLPEMWRFRDLFMTLAVRDLKIRYKQTALGVFWVVFQPLLAAGIFSFVFGNVANFEAPGGTPYFLFTFVGMLVWSAFSKTLSRSSSSLVSNASLISKIYFPRLILPFSKVFAALIDFAVGLGLLAALLAIFWQAPGWHVLFMPVPLFLMLLLAMGVGFYATALSVKYRDVNYIVPVLVQSLLYASPVAYSVMEVPQQLRTLYYLNPLAALLEAFRWSVLGTGDVRWGFFYYSAAACIGIFAAGAFLFKRMERGFADVI